MLPTIVKYQVAIKPVGEYARWAHAVEAARTRKAVMHFMESAS